MTTTQPNQTHLLSCRHNRTESKSLENKMELLDTFVEKINDNDAVGLQELMKIHNTKVEAEDKQGMTMLQHASFKGKREMCQLLIDLVSLFCLWLRYIYCVSEFFIFCYRALIRTGGITSTSTLPCILPRYRGTPISASFSCSTGPKLM